MSTLSNLLQSRFYWMAIALIGMTLLLIALYYQHVLGDEPCQACIHARLWVLAFTLIGLFMFISPQIRPLRILGNTGVLIASAGVTERAINLHRLENGIADGSCQFQLGMPRWFAVDRWVPWLFEVRSLCSFTPEILFGISMAETLMTLATGLFLLAIWTTALDLRR